MVGKIIPKNRKITSLKEFKKRNKNA